MTATFGPDPALLESVGEFFSSAFDAAPTAGMEDPAGPALAGSWTATAELGFPLVGIPEEQGGSGGSLQDLLAVLLSAGRHAVPLPLAETSLACWLLASAGIDLSVGPATVILGDARDTLLLADGRISGIAHDVPWARGVAVVVALVDDPAGRPQVVSIDPSGCRLAAGTDLAGQPRDRLEFSATPVVACAPATVSRAELFWRGALVRATQMAGALAAVDQITRRYTSQRVQFGRPIGRFQAVQQHVVTIAQAAELAAMGVWAAARAATVRDGSFETCAAKLLANESARTAIRSAHQAHGAVGMTQEYSLHRYTRRLNSWRQEFGTEAQLAAALGAAAATAQSFAHVISDPDNGVAVPCPT
jgi:acyl-CoA dehydrogenase